MILENTSYDDITSLSVWHDRTADPWLVIRQCFRTTVQDRRISFKLAGETSDTQSIIRIENGQHWTSHITLRRIWAEPGDKELLKPIRDRRGRLVSGLPLNGVYVDGSDLRSNEHHIFETVVIGSVVNGYVFQHTNGIDNILKDGCAVGRAVNAITNLGGLHDQCGQWTSYNFRANSCETVIRITKPPGTKRNEMHGLDAESCGVLFNLGLGEGGRQFDAMLRLTNIRFAGKPEDPLSRSIIGVCHHDSGLEIDGLYEAHGTFIFAHNPNGIKLFNAPGVKVRELPRVRERDGTIRLWNPDKDNIRRGAAWPSNWIV